MNNRTLLILAIVVIGIVIAALSFLNTQPAVRPSQAVALSSPAPATEPPRERPRRDLPATPSPEKVAAPIPKPPPRPLEPWEYKIDEVLRSNADESQTAQILINMLPSLPPDGQAEAAQHIANLLLDKDYSKVLPLVKNPNLSEEVLDVFVTDLMNRDDATKLPTLLEIARIPNHPHREEALTDIGIFTDEESEDLPTLQRAVQKYLQEQAAEEAAEAAAANAPKPSDQ